MADAHVEMNRTASLTLSVGSLNCPGASMRRFRLYDFIFGSEASPADNAFLVQIQRCTTAGTATSVTPQLLDPADAAVVTTAGENHSSDPTLTSNAILLALGLNQRSSFRWVAVPGKEIVVPATANNGVAVRTPSGATVAVTASCYFSE